MRTLAALPRRVSAALRSDAGHRLAVGLVIALQTAIALHGIANYWQWGHHGFNGAAFAHAARNSLRFDIVAEAQYHTAATPPPPEALYTHHPLLLHFHLVALMRLLGDAEWVPRLVPAFYSIASQVLLYVFVRRYYGRLVALISALAYALIPLGAMYANMINHEQGAIFWSLLFLYAYCRFFESASKRMALLALVSVSLAIQFDWAPYHLALFVAIHAFLGGVRKQTRLLDIRPEHVFAVLLSVVVLSNFAAFYAFVLHVRGSFDEMMASARQRSSEPPGYWPLVARHAFDLQGPVFLPLLAAFHVRFVTRLVRGEAHLGDLVPVFFTGVQLVQSTVFKEAGFIHAYWTYHLNPALAVAAGSVLVGAGRVLRGGLRDIAACVLRRRPGRGGTLLARVLAAVGAVTALLVVALPLSYAAVDTNRKVRAQFVSGFGTYVAPYDDQFLLVQATRHALRDLPRARRDALVHPSIAYRIEWLYYLDAPRRDAPSLESVEAMPKSQPGRHRLVFLDLVAARGAAGLGGVVARHRSTLYDDRFLIVDLDDPRPDFVAYRSVALPMPLWWRWLVSPVHPPIRWERSPDATFLRLAVASSSTVLSERSFGAPTGGRAMRWRCPDGYAIDALETTPARWLRGPTFGSLRVRCRRLVPGAQVDHPDVESPTFGIHRQGEPRRIACPATSVVVGLGVATNPYPYELGVRCRSIAEVVAEASSRGAPSEPSPPPALPDTSHAAAGRHAFDCPAGSVAQGIVGSFGDLTDRIGIACVAVDSAFVETARTLRPAGGARPRRPDARAPGLR